MNDEDISTLLWRLENGEVSEDESDLDEDALDYYDNVGELQADLERENQILEEILTENDGTAPDPPLIFDELVENQPHSNATPSLRDLIWKKKNLDLVDQAFTFLGCTVQRNRLGKTCKLPKKEDVQKTSVPRGSYDENVASLDGVEFAATSWKDNKQVLLLSTYVGANPVGTISRYDKKQKKNISIPCPKVIEEYNAHMGGVDTMDSYLGRYRIRMKSKKWTNRLFQHMLDMAVINSWILYKKVSLKKKTNPKNILKLVDFRTELAETLCKYGAVSENKRGRPSMNRQENTSKKETKDWCTDITTKRRPY
ncbi:unnamed protein product [Parnassius apollo]|uniref:(apollo) hypothetical protein n=1 Tax=Parnassius apollo TaxID=110799 RepID=A0A8S3Y0Q8_PARAO|nr:unnamed protein product [Parnassius apollo]